MQGRLGHQALGQMLVMDNHEIAVAGASVVIAASSGTKSAAAQVALRTAAPAVAAHILISRDEERLVKARDLLEKRQRAIAAATPVTPAPAPPVAPPPPAVAPAPAPLAAAAPTPRAKGSRKAPPKTTRRPAKRGMPKRK